MQVRLGLAEGYRCTYVVGIYTSDEYARAPRYGKYWLTSVVLNMTSPVQDAISQATSGGFRGGLYVGTLGNGGIAIAPFLRLGGLVSPSLRKKLSTMQRPRGRVGVNRPGGQHPT